MLGPDYVTAMGANGDSARVRSETARRLFQATNGLLRYELAILHGRPNDEDVFAALLATFCQAMRAAGLATMPMPPPPSRRPAARRQTAVEVEPVEPLAPTPKLRFARWLAERGRLSG